MWKPVSCVSVAAFFAIQGELMGWMLGMGNNLCFSSSMSDACQWYVTHDVDCVGMAGCVLMSSTLGDGKSPMAQSVFGTLC